MALEDDWYEPVLETWLMDLKLYGFEIKDNEIYFRLSYSQGDGASFDIKEVNVKQFLERIDKVSDFETFLYYENLGSFTPTFYTSKNSFSTYYCHEKTRDLEYELICHDDFEVEPDYSKVVLEANTIFKLIEETRLEICKDIYNNLREYSEDLEKLENEEEDEE